MKGAALLVIVPGLLFVLLLVLNIVREVQAALAVFP